MKSPYNPLQNIVSKHQKALGRQLNAIKNMVHSDNDDDGSDSDNWSDDCDGW